MAAFDAAAATYDADFTHRQLALWLRESVRAWVPFVAGQQILELGCGTGEDALWLANRGVHVTATDVSAGMLAQTGEKTAHLPVETRHFDMNQPDEALPGDFDGVFSNFGALNCIDATARRRLAAFLAARVLPGGKLALVVMNPACPWEIGWHLLHAQPRAALRRFRADRPAHIADGETIQVWYPAPRRLKNDFAPHFRPIKTVGIGSLLPPSYLAHLVERWPRSFAHIARWDARVAALPPFSHFNDHYLMILERRS